MKNKLGRSKIPALSCSLFLVGSIRKLFAKVNCFQKGVICKHANHTFSYSSGNSFSMVARAAACSARFLLLPEPQPTTVPLSSTCTSNFLS